MVRGDQRSLSTWHRLAAGGTNLRLHFTYLMGFVMRFRPHPKRASVCLFDPLQREPHPLPQRGNAQVRKDSMCTRPVAVRSSRARLAPALQVRCHQRVRILIGSGNVKEMQFRFRGSRRIPRPQRKVNRTGTLRAPVAE